MTGTQEFKIVVQPAPENPSLTIIDVHRRRGDFWDDHSWIGEVKDELVLDSVIEVLKASYERA